MSPRQGASLISSINSTELYRIIDNHLINGSVVYSTELTSRNHTYQGGEPFVITAKSTGGFVTSGEVTIRIM